MIKVTAPKKYQQTKEELEKLLLKYDLMKLLEQFSGLKWKTKTLYIKHKNLGQSADWEGDNTALVDFGVKNAINCFSSASHEFAHLLLKENTWSQAPNTKKFINNHPELNVSNPKRGDGYLLEQALVFSLQSNVCKYLGEKKDRPGLIDYLGKHWERTLKLNFCEKIGKNAFVAWQNKSDKLNMVEWVNKNCKEWSN